MRKFINEGPGQLLAAEAGVKDVSRFLSGYRPGSIVLGGMGGSVLGGGIAKTLLGIQSRSPEGEFRINRDYSSSKSLDGSCLAILISYSGETEETISLFHQAVEQGARVLVLASGGTLWSLASEMEVRGVLAVRIPKGGEGFQPRFSIYYTAGFLLGLLKKLEWLDAEVDLGGIAGKLGDEMDALENEGRAIAEELGGRIPIVYSSTHFESSIARIWKIKFNENCKIPSFFASLPEVNHNEMIGWQPEFADQFAFLLMEEEGIDERTRKRFDIFSNLMEQAGYRCIRPSPGSPANLFGIFRSLLLADWVTNHRASLFATDPVSIPMIQSFKKMLATSGDDD